MTIEETESTEAPAESTSLADALGAAWDNDPTTEETTADEEGTSGLAAAELPAGDGDAERTPTGDKADDTPVPGAAESIPLAESAGGDEGNAPVSWNATAREQWTKIPKEAQEYIKQRESEFEQGITKYAQGAQRAEQMDQVLAPYGQYFAMNGGAGQTINTLLQTGANLQMGSPIQKAEMVASIIKQYGVDIGTLDNMLVGQPAAPEQQQQTAIQQQITEAMAPFQQYMGGVQQQQQQAATQQQHEATSSVSQFAADPKNEFYRDVSGDMADILDMAANQGRQMSMADAYSRACQLNEPVRQIIEGRKAAQVAANKRRPASSIQGGMGGPGGLSEPGSRREAIDRAWDAAGQN